MSALPQVVKRSVWVGVGAAAMLAAGCAMPAKTGFALSGSQQVPPVTTTATATSNITVNGYKDVFGGVVVSGVEVTAAHIHMGAAGKNGPPVVTLIKRADGAWMVPTNTTLSDGQFAAYNAGELYVNVHSAANKGGEVRAQLTP